jgi:signal transduction histidine kinase
MKQAIRYFTAPYLSDPLGKREKVRGVVISCLLAIPSMLITVVLHWLDHKSYVVILGDVQFFFLSIFSLYLILRKKPVAATTFFIISLSLLVVFHNLLNDWLYGESLTHYRILETLIVFVLCLLAATSFVQKSYQLFLIIGAGMLTLPLHYNIIMRQSGTDFFETGPFTFLLAYMIVFFILGALSCRVLFVFGKLLKRVEDESQLIRDQNLELESKVDERTRELQQQNRTLKKVNSELDRFVYSASHDLRAPLTSVLGLARLIGSESNPEEMHHYAQLQEQSIQKLDFFIQDIVNISKNARTEIRQDKIIFSQLLSDTLDRVNDLHNGPQIVPIVQVSQQHAFYADKQRVGIILHNLLSNAFRFASPHRRKPCVKVCIDVLPQHAAITIEDNGQGIAEEHLDKIFEMFFRVRQNGTGSGLGLYIVRETLDKLGGDISVSSTLGKGTIFTVKIPSEVPCHSFTNI